MSCTLVPFLLLCLQILVDVPPSIGWGGNHLGRTMGLTKMAEKSELKAPMVVRTKVASPIAPRGSRNASKGNAHHFARQ